MRAKGRKALVTGAAGGLGQAESAALAREGAVVLMLDILEEKGRAAAEAINAELPEGCTPVRLIVGDLSDLAASKRQVEGLAEEVGGIDILVNNAAMIPLKPIEDYSIEEWETVQRVNAHAAFALTRAVLPHMKAQNWGRIVNLCSITLNGGWKDFTCYVSSKGMLLGFTRSLARELGPWHITVNAISPGAIPTDSEMRVWGDQWESYNQFLLDHQSLKFRGSTEDIAKAMMFLVSDDARFMTGQNLHVDGGWYMS
jgi:3-oxoacyl-[acyl-carrier protein] reductase